MNKNVEGALFIIAGFLAYGGYLYLVFHTRPGPSYRSQLQQCRAAVKAMQDSTITEKEVDDLIKEFAK